MSANLFNLDDITHRVPAPHLIGDGQHDRGRLLMSFDDRAPAVRFTFDASDPTPPDREDLDRAVLSGWIGSTREANSLGLVGPPGADSDVIERVVIGPDGDHDEQQGDEPGEVQGV